ERSAVPPRCGSARARGAPLRAGRRAGRCLVRGCGRRRGARCRNRCSTSRWTRRARRHPGRRPQLLRRRRGAQEGADARALPAHARGRPAARDRSGAECAARACRARERAVSARGRTGRVLRPRRAAGIEGGGRAVTCALGIDFGTESARALLVDCANGRELGTSVAPYEHGVLDAHLPAPDGDVPLEVDWALQDPRDYVAAVRAAVPRLLADTGVSANEVVGIGIDFTSCTMLPTLADGTPLCVLEELRREPHAWVKLWKHHAAQPEADRINAVAAERGEPW